MRLSKILLQNVPAREGAVLHDRARLRVGCEINVFVSYGQVLHLWTGSHKSIALFIYCTVLYSIPADLHARLMCDYLRFLLIFSFAAINWTGGLGDLSDLRFWSLFWSVLRFLLLFRFFVVSYQQQFSVYLLFSFRFWVFDDKEIAFSVLFHYLLG